MNDSYRNRAELSIAQGALTNSKRPSTFIEGVYPTHATYGKGATIYAEKKLYIDFICGLGTNLLGYGNPRIRDAISDRYMKGATLSLSSELEVEAAEKLKSLFPAGELWKFTKTGTDACAAAIKIARTYTGRDLVLSDGYHGWSDDFISMSEPGCGVPKRSWMRPLDFSLIPEAAAVIIEPVILDYSRERRAYLEKLRQECTKHGTVLIFDEIITGFRFLKMSVSNYFGIHPDIILLGKAMAAGMPLSALGGKKEIMNCGEYFVSGTFFGEQCSLDACLATIKLINQDGSKYDLKELWSAGEMFLNRFNELSDALKILGYPTRGAFQGDDMVKALFWQEACKAGILFGPSWFFNFPLMEFTDRLMPVFRDIFSRIKVGAVRLEGKLPSKPYSQTVRECTDTRKE
jgi:glutamate-1-semialdehyde 2,1-aminomutase